MFFGISGAFFLIVSPELHFKIHQLFLYIMIFLFIHTTVFLFLAMFTDPGIIPRKHILQINYPYLKSYL